MNEFWIAGENEFPCLVVLVNNDSASVTYFPEDGHPGFQSVGTDTNLESGETSIFYANTPTEVMEVGNDMVIPFSKALKAAEEFFHSLELPKGIEWFEL